MDNNNTISIKISEELAPGQIMLRQEIIGLHITDMPEFYPVCVQMNLKSPGNIRPSDGLVAFPGVCLSLPALTLA